MGLVSSTNSNRKRVFWDGRNFAPGHFCPQSHHLDRLTHKIGELWFSTKIQTENVFLGKMNSRGLLRQNWAKFPSETILPPNAQYSQLGPEKRHGAGFVKKFRLKTCFLGWTKFCSGTLLPPIAPYSQLGLEKRYGAGFVNKFQPKTCFLVWTKLRSGTLLPTIVPSSPFGLENRWDAI